MTQNQGKSWMEWVSALLQKQETPHRPASRSMQPRNRDKTVWEMTPKHTYTDVYECVCMYDKCVYKHVHIHIHSYTHTGSVTQVMWVKFLPTLLLVMLFHHSKSDPKRETGNRRVGFTVRDPTALSWRGLWKGFGTLDKKSHWVFKA